MRRSWPLLVAGLALLAASMAMTWSEAHRPWQAWAERYNAQPNVTPVPGGVQALVPTQTGKPELCVTCHVGMEDISPSHAAEAIGCVSCHGGDPLALDADRAHATLHGGRNPSDLAVAQESCAADQCHGGYADPEQNHVERVLRSLQSTYAGGIAAVRYAFGAQPSAAAQFGIHAVTDARRPLPAKALPTLQELSGRGAAPAVDTRLEQRCLEGGCHLWAPPQAAPYFYRSTGCAACHYPYADDGLYRGSDPTIARGQPGHGSAHRLTTAIPYTQCNHCHNRGNYSLKQMAFLPREDLPPAAAPLSPQMPPEGRRLLEYYQPLGDFTRCEYELNCIDCHTSQEVMGDGHLYGAKKDVQYVQCQTCHGTPASAPRTAAIREPNELAMRQARLGGHADFLAVGDRVVQTERGELLWSVKEVGSGRLVQIDKVEGKIYDVPLVRGSRCTQDGASQEAAYCHECHAVAR